MLIYIHIYGYILIFNAIYIYSYLMKHANIYIYIYTAASFPLLTTQSECPCDLTLKSEHWEECWGVGRSAQRDTECGRASHRHMLYKHTDYLPCAGQKLLNRGRKQSPIHTEAIDVNVQITVRGYEQKSLCLFSHHSHCCYDFLWPDSDSPGQCWPLLRQLPAQTCLRYHWKAGFTRTDVHTRWQANASVRIHRHFREWTRVINSNRSFPRCCCTITVTPLELDERTEYEGSRGNSSQQLSTASNSCKQLAWRTADETILSLMNTLHFIWAGDQQLTEQMKNNGWTALRDRGQPDRPPPLIVVYIMNSASSPKSVWRVRGSIRPGWVWCLLSRSCWCPPPTPPSMPTTNYSYTLSYSLNVLFLCNDSFWSHYIYYSVHPGEGFSSVALLKVSLLFSSVKGFVSLFFGSSSWSDERSKVRDVVCVQIVKPAEANS